MSTVITVASGKRPASAPTAGSSPDAFVATIVERYERGRVVGCRHAGVADAPLKDAEAVAIQRVRVVAPPREHRNLAYGSQMPCEEVLPMTPALTMQKRSITPSGRACHRRVAAP